MSIIRAPADGVYDLWFYYGAMNAPHGRTDMAGRTTMQVDDSEPVLLDNLRPDARRPTKVRVTGKGIRGEHE